MFAVPCATWRQYEKILEEAKSASHSAQEAAQKFAKNNPKERWGAVGHVMFQDFEEYEKNAWEPTETRKRWTFDDLCLFCEVREAATAAATALEKAHAHLKKEAR